MTQKKERIRSHRVLLVTSLKRKLRARLHLLRMPRAKPPLKVKMPPLLRKRKKMTKMLTLSVLQRKNLTLSSISTSTCFSSALRTLRTQL